MQVRSFKQHKKGDLPKSTQLAKKFTSLQPDLTIEGDPVVAGRPARWNSVVIIDPQKNRIKSSGGQCFIPLSFRAKNRGTGNAMNFEVRVKPKGPGVPVTIREAPLPRGSSRKVEAVYKLKKGRHTLNVVLDPGNRVRESNEKNNNFTLTIYVKQDCQPHGELQKKPVLPKGRVPVVPLKGLKK